MILKNKVNKFGLALLFSTSLAFSVNAREIKTNTAQMQAMDKVTGKVEIINVPVNGEYKFGTFSIVARDCQTRPPEETPENFAFIDVVDINFDGSKENIFKGWMISSSPSLNAVEHPVYDVWLLKCVDREIDKTKMLSAEELEQRDEIAKRASEVSHLKEDVIEEVMEEIENNNRAVEETENPSMMPGIDEEVLMKKLEELGINNANSTEVIVSGFETTTSEEIHDVDGSINEQGTDETAQDIIIVDDGKGDVIDATPFEDDEEPEDDSPRSLINFKKLSGEE